MVRVMNPAGQFLFLLICCLFSGRQVAGSPEPVFIKDELPSNSLVTQTVYGFLDFTTTIGNTIMVFSPQSAAADSGKDKTTASVVNEVIDTKPVTSVETQPPPTIKPSKTVTNDEKKSSDTPKDIYTVVNVQQKPTSVVSTTKSVINLQPSSKVNIIEGTTSVVNVLPVTKTSELKNVVTKVEVITGTVEQKKPPVMSSIVQTIKAESSSVLSQLEVPLDKDEPAIAVGNNIGEPEYDFLSRQPSEVVEETYKVVNLKQSTKFHLKPRPTVDPKTKPTRGAAHPTGLVTKLGGTVVKDGVTTVHETSVIGTYISGKYAQVLQSTSHVSNNHPKGKINPSPSLRILKTAAPNIGRSNKHQHLESIPTLSHDEVSSAENTHHSQKSHKKSKSPSKPRPKHPSRDHEVENHEVIKSVTPQPSYKKARTVPPTRSAQAQHNTSHRPHKSNKKHGRKRSRLATVSVPSEPPPTTPAPTVQQPGRKFSPRKTKSKPTTTSAENNSNNNNNVFAKKSYKVRNQIQPTEPTSAENSSIYKFKLNRTPGRWQYKTTPKPRITIRKQNDEEQNNSTLGATTSPVDVHPHLNDIVTPQVRPDEADSFVGSESIASITGDENSVENKIDKQFPLETIKVEISTPPDFKDTYYEIATIKSPYVFQAGNVKNTRFITITSTFEKVLDSSTTDINVNPTKAEPLTENILATSHNYEKDNNFLDSSIATLPPLYMATDMETPPLETVTETFSTTQTMLKTHILPAIRSQNETLSYTLIQTYVITRFVTATKTLPPMEAYHFVPSRILKDFNSHLDEAGSELNLELAFGDDNEDNDSQVRKSLPADLDLAQIGSDFDLSEVDKLNIPMEMHLRSKKAHPPKQRVEQAAVTPNLSPEQLQQLAILRLLNPAAVGALQPQPQVITTSKPLIKVETVYESHVIPIVNGRNTFLTTISRSVGMATKTDYEFGTSTVAPQLPNLPLPPINPLFQQPQQQYAITTSPIVQTTQVTHTNSKVLKLTFGAKTAHTTIISTTVIPTVLTTFITGSVAVQPTAAFPGFFPAPYAPYPYVG